MRYAHMLGTPCSLLSPATQQMGRGKILLAICKWRCETQFTLIVFLSATKEMNKAAYRRPLKNGEIRLITLLPGTFEARIRCKLTYHNLGKSLKYDALSYRWGCHKKTAIIRVDGRQVNVTTNLDSWV